MGKTKEKGVRKLIDFFKEGTVSHYHKIFFKNINAVIYIHDQKGRIIYLNEFAERISHYKIEELLGKHFKKIVAPESLPVAYHAFRTQLSGKNVKPFELTVLDKNGQRIHLKTTETVILDRSGKVNGVLGIATDITEHKELTQRLSKMVKELNLLHIIGQELSAILDIDLLLYRIVKHLKETLGYERAAVGLIDLQRNELIIRAAEPRYPRSVMARLKVKLGEGITGYVAKTGKPYLCNDVSKDPHYIIFDKNTKSEVAVPLKVGDKIIGVINIESYHEDTFDEDDVQTLTLIANQAAIAIENSRLYNSLKQSYLDSIKTLVSAIEAKDHYTYGHSERVRKYALQIARELKLSPQQIEELNYAGYLHDIGKIGINDRILTKPESLTPSEYEVIKKHPSIGHNILRSAHHLAGASQIIKYEHERYDGTGYPNGLKDGEIPIGARIIAVADAYDAMTTDRPYRQALSKKEAIKRLKENMGTQFDPKVVRAFLKIIKRK
ncbi:MAG: HD domain-containing phosphohydrolase [candidate division WOR-3 bacterium]